jgi:hypothetical protein
MTETRPGTFRRFRIGHKSMLESNVLVKSLQRNKRRFRLLRSLRIMLAQHKLVLWSSKHKSPGALHGSESRTALP